MGLWRDNETLGSPTYKYSHNLGFIPCITISLFDSKVAEKWIQWTIFFNIQNWMNLTYSQRPVVNGETLFSQCESKV